MSKPRYDIILMLLALMATEAVAKQLPEQVTMDLRSAYTAALANDPSLSAAQHAHRAQTETVSQAKAGLLPSITATVSSEATGLKRQEPAVERSRSGQSFRASLSQPLFRLERWYGLKAAKASVIQSELELAAKEQALIFNTAESYFEALRSRELSMASKAEVKALSRQRDQAKAKLEEGAATITDFLDAQSALDIANANWQKSEQRVADSLDALERLTGKPVESLASLQNTLPVVLPEPNNSALWVATGMKQNLELQAKGLAVTTASLTVSQQQASHMPTVDIVASYRKGDNDSFGYSNPADFGSSGYSGSVAQSSIGIEINIPIFSGGQVSSKVRESKERLYQKQDENEDKTREVAQAVRKAFRAISSDIDQVKAQYKSIESGRLSLEANEVGNSVGTRNIVDVIEAERRLYAAIRDYNNARFDYILDTLRLKHAVGTLSSADIESLSGFLSTHTATERDYFPQQAQKNKISPDLETEVSKKKT